MPWELIEDVVPNDSPEIEGRRGGSGGGISPFNSGGLCPILLLMTEGASSAKDCRIPEMTL